MLANSITLQTSLATTPVDVEFSRYEEHLDRTVYIGDDHSLERKHTLSLYRTQPKRVGNNRGQAKAALKVFHEAAVLGADQTTNVINPGVGDVMLSIPVGATDAFIEDLLDELISSLQHAEIRSKLIKKLEI